MPDTVRTYTARLELTAQQSGQLYEYGIKNNKAKAAVVDMMITTRASLGPEDVAVYTDDARTTAAWLMTAYWLVPERDHQCDPRYIVTSDQVRDTYKSLLEQAGVAPAEWVELVEPVLRSLESREDAQIVNRRAIWQDSKHVLCGASMTPSEVLDDMWGGCVLAAEPRDVTNEETARSCATVLLSGLSIIGDDVNVKDMVVSKLNQQVSNLVSHRWGTGTGANWPAVAEQYTVIEQAVTRHLETNRPVDRAALARELVRLVSVVRGDNQCDPADPVVNQLLDLLRYSGDRLHTFNLLLVPLSRVDAESDEDLVGAVAWARKAHRDTIRKVSDKGPRAWSVELERKINEIGIWNSELAPNGKPYYTTGPMVEICLGAMTVAITNSTNMRSRLVEMRANIDQVDALEKETAGWAPVFVQYEKQRVEAAYLTGADIAGYCIRPSAVRGVSKVTKMWGDTTDLDSRLQALEQFHTNTAIDGDLEVFKWLAECWAPGMPILKWAQLNKLRQALGKARVPAVRYPNFETAPHYPLFGHNACKSRFIGFAKNSPTQQQALLEMTLGSTLTILVPVVSDRLAQLNAVQNPSAPIASRNGRLAQLAATRSSTSDISWAFRVVMLQVRPGRPTTDGSWEPTYINVPVHLTPSGPAIQYRAAHGLTEARSLHNLYPYHNDLLCNDASHRDCHYKVLGIDLGIRSEAAWSVMRVVSEEHINSQLAQPVGPMQQVCKIGKVIYRRVDRSDGMWGHLEKSGIIDTRSTDWRPRGDQREKIEQVETLLTHGRILDTEMIGRWNHTGATPRLSVNHLTRISLARRTIQAFKIAIARQSQWARMTHPDPTSDLVRAIAKDEYWAPLLDEVQALALVDPVAAQGRAIAIWREHDARLVKAWHIALDMIDRGHQSSRRSLLSSLTHQNQIYVLRRLRWLQKSISQRPQAGSSEPLYTAETEFFGGRLHERYNNIRSANSQKLANQIVKTAAIHGCQGVVVERMSDYRMSDKRPPRENRMLAEWAKANLDTNIQNICWLNGIAYKAVNPKGTSQTVFATATRGVRVIHVTPDRWDEAKFKSRVRAARKTQEDTPIAEYTLSNPYLASLIQLSDWLDNWRSLNTGGLPIPAKGVYVPLGGGQYIEHNLARPGSWRGAMNADINASQNIALRGLEPKMDVKARPDVTTKPKARIKRSNLRKI